MAGHLRATILHMRPRSWPVVAGHMLAGSAAGASAGALTSHAAWLLLAAALWAVGLNGGTLALNGAVDRDEGDVGYLDAPPTPPTGLALFGTLLMLASLVPAWLAASRGHFTMLFPWLLAGSVVLSLLYSLPPVRLKARAGWDLAVNCLGYGALTFWAGVAATGHDVDGATVWAGAGFGLLFAALYPLTQIYQMEDDRRQGVRTLALVMGRRGSLVMATTAAAAALLCLGAAVATRHPGQAAWALLTLALPLTLWGRVLLPHLVTGGAHCGKETMYGGLRAWAVTDLMAALALMPGLIRPAA